MAACRSIFENILKYVDSLLQPNVFHIKKYIKDTRDFFHIIEGLPIPEQSLIISFDVA